MERKNSMKKEEGLRSKLVEFIKAETIKMNPEVNLDDVDVKLGKAEISDLIDLTIFFMDKQNKEEGYYGEKEK